MGDRIIPLQREGYVDVVAGALERDGRVFAAERGYGTFEGFWEYPGGKVEQGETPEAALIRELNEELNLAVTSEELTYFDTFYHEYPGLKVALHIFIVHNNLDGLELREHNDSDWFTKEDIDNVIWLQSTYQINEELIKRGIIK